MQDSYVGDIGDFGKYGLLRQINRTPLRLAVNWYHVFQQKPGKQNDGKFIDYLTSPNQYRRYDPKLFDVLRKIVVEEASRSLHEIEKSNIIEADFYSEVISGNRSRWHQNAIIGTRKADVVFLDPDNGLETEHMHQRDSATEKHVKWDELKDYYDRGQSVILYQHRPQMTKKDICIQSILTMNDGFLCADHVYLLEFPRYTNRFYFFFVHHDHSAVLKQVCDFMDKNWDGLCRQIDFDE